MWPGAPATAAPPSTQPLKDPRQLRDRNVQNRMRKEVSEWLREIGYPEPNALYNITGKDYRSIFEALVSLIDRNHWTDQTARFEDSFIAALKSLRYPFVGQIDIKGLAAPASMHAWPALLGVLHWLVEECKVCRGSSSYERKLILTRLLTITNKAITPRSKS
jgi:kinetochore protein NDC80